MLTLLLSEFVTVVEKLASSPKAAASSLSVSSVLGAEFAKLETAVFMFVFIWPEVKNEPVSDFCTRRPVAVCRAERSTPVINPLGLEAG